MIRQHLRPARIACLVGFVISLVWVAPSQLAAQGGPALVALTPIVKRKVREAQLFVGTVQPSRRAVIGSAVDGRVVTFPINEGDRVDANQELASLLTETIKLELQAAEAELALRSSELAELENGSRPDEIRQAKARLSAAKANADYRAITKKRTETLYAQRGAATSQQVDEAVSLAVAANEALTEAEAAYQLALDGPRPERIAQAKARVDIQAAIVERLKDQIKKHTMYARFPGYVVQEHTEVGQWVSRGDPVAEIVALDEVDVEAQVVESQVPFVHVGDTVRVDVPALPDKIFSGQVVSIVPQADPRSRTFPVKIRIQNELNQRRQPLLKSGMFAKAVLPTGALTEATLVPKDAIVFGGPTAAIWVVDESKAKPVDGSSLLTAPAELVSVQLGVSDGPLIQVMQGIDESRSVVSLGNERIIPSRSGDPNMVQWRPTDK